MGAKDFFEIASNNLIAVYTKVWEQVYLAGRSALLLKMALRSLPREVMG